MSNLGIKILDGGLSTELVRLGYNPQVKFESLFLLNLMVLKITRIANYGLENLYLIDQIF